MLISNTAFAATKSIVPRANAEGSIGTSSKSWGGGFFGTGYFSGNVGISSTTPSAALDVQGTTKTTAFQLPTNASAGYVLTSNTVGVGTWMPLAGGSASAAGGTSAIQYNSGSSTFAGDETKFAFTGSNVGINSLNPGARLTVKQTASEDPFHVASSSSTSLFKVTGSGNVGIGSSTPGNTLDVQGIGRFSSTLTASNLSGTNTGDQINISGNAATVTTNANLTGPITSVGNATSIASQTGTGAKFVMDTSPTLTTPNIGSATGSVSGNAGTATALAANGTNCSAGQYPLGVDASGNSENCTAAGGGASQWITYGGVGNVGIGTTDSVGVGTTLQTGAGLIVMNGNVGIGTWIPKNIFDSKGSMAMGSFAGVNSAPSNSLIVSGNIGIGTVSTVGNLTVAETGSGNGVIVTSVATGWPVFGNQIDGVTKTFFGTARVASDCISNVTVANDTCLRTQGGAIHFSTNSGTAAVMSIMGANGNVGIGTITPQNKLAIVGNLAVGSAGNVGIAAPTNGLYVQGNVGIGTLTPSALLEIGARKFDVLSGGNVGIGTINPGNLLDVQGNIRVANIGSTLGIVSGTNACHGTATLSSGTTTVNTTCAPSLAQNIFLTDSGGGVLANIGALSVGTVTGGTSFVINSANALDSSNVGWIIFN